MCIKRKFGGLLLASVMFAASGMAVAQHAATHGGRAAGHAVGGHAPAAGAHQHYDGRFSHNQFYYDRGFAVRRPPSGGLGEVHDRHGGRYWRHGGNWYRWDGRRWIVWAAPFGLFVSFLPWYYTTVWWGGIPYYYANDTYYVWDESQQQYQVAQPPDGLEASEAMQPPPSNEFFAYPSNGQSSEQQGKDRAECQAWASAQSGFDPNDGGNATPSGQLLNSRNDYFRAQVSCLEGRGYTVR